MTKSIVRTLLPLITGVLIIGSAGILIHFYRSTWSSGEFISPVLPRAQFSFSVQLPQNRTDKDLPLLLRVVKEKNSPLTVNYWPEGRTVFQMPVVALNGTESGKTPPIRLALWDAGRYTVTFEDTKTGSPVQSLSLQVGPPFGLFRNDFLLLLLLAFAGYFSGKMAIESLSSVSVSNRLRAPRKPLFYGLFFLSLLLIVSSTVFTKGVPPPTLSPKTSGFLESEGNADAPRMILPLISGNTDSSTGYLLLRHRLDSWLRFGQDLTLFEGPINLHSSHLAFLLPPDDGRYRLSLWSGHKDSLSVNRSVIRAIPFSPIFPVGLFLGLALFPSSFFLLGFTSSRRIVPGAMTERLH